MFSIEQRELLLNIGFSDTAISSPTDSDLIDIEEKVGDYLTLRCLDKDYMPNAEGLLCEEILSKIAG